MLQEDIYIQSTQYSVNLTLNFQLFVSLAAPLDFDLNQIGKPLFLES